MPTANTQIAGSLSATRHLTAGGNATIRGNATISGTLKVDGWLDAPNVKQPGKGLYADADALADAYPHPQPGWWALVGSQWPVEVYRSQHGRWTATGATVTDLTIDFSHYQQQIDAINDTIDQTNATVDTLCDSLTDLEHPIALEDTDTADLIIADGERTPIVTFADGHVRTACFDSASLTSLTTINGYMQRLTQQFEKLAGKRLSVIGDSISTYSGALPSGYGAAYPASDVTDIGYTWWRHLADELRMTILRNCSWSGTTVAGDSDSTTSATAGCSTRRVTDLSDGTNTPDLIIIAMGVNDWIRNVALGECADYADIPDGGTVSEFSKAYALLLKKLMETYPAATVYCMTPMEVGPYVRSGAPIARLNASGRSVAEYGARIRQIAAMMGAKVIDAHSCGITYANHEHYLHDHLHPNRAGHQLMYECARNTLINTY